LLSILTWFAFSPSALAQVVVGQTASVANPPLECLAEKPTDELQLTVASGPSYVIPSAGVITSWSTFAHGGLNQTMTLKVFRKVGPFSYVVVAQDARALIPNVLNTSTVEIPVQAGDRIGESLPGEKEVPCVFETTENGDLVIFAEESDVHPGGTVTFPGFAESQIRLNVSASVQPPPTITTISPSSGSFKGGTTITVTGTNLEGGRVSFGGIAAPRVSYLSDHQLTVVTPPTQKPMAVPIAVTTVAGTAASPQPFSTTACVVPRLSGATLKAAKRKLRNADCKIGTVRKLKGAALKTGKVVRQNPRPGTALAPGSRVSVQLGVGS
jgi:hypothetical protein